jgi:peptidoglycan/LPS O-acetylase OafA/YrhL
MKPHNSLDLIRLIAAILVIVGHSPVLLGQSNTFDIIGKIIGCQSIHGLSVDIFFIISGFLITKSFLRTNNPMEYLKNRVLRIYPGLLFSLILVFLISYCLQELNIYNYLITNKNFLLNILLIKHYYTIEGVFSSNNLKEINGSLWTLKYEFIMYLIVLFLGVFKVLKKELVLLSTIVILFLFFQNISTQTWSFFDIQYKSLLHFGMFFLFGSTIYFYEYQLKIYKHLPIIMFLGYFIVRIFVPNSDFRINLLMIWFPILTLIIGKEPFKFSYNSKKWGDYSYGIYLWGWPVQQFLINKFEFFKSNNHYCLSLIAIIISFVFAFFSWHFVEKPSLKLKS